MIWRLGELLLGPRSKHNAKAVPWSVFFQAPQREITCYKAVYFCKLLSHRGITDISAGDKPIQNCQGKQKNILEVHLTHFLNRDASSFYFFWNVSASFILRLFVAWQILPSGNAERDSETGRWSWTFSRDVPAPHACFQRHHCTITYLNCNKSCTKIAIMERLRNHYIFSPKFKQYFISFYHYAWFIRVVFYPSSPINDIA